MSARGFVVVPFLTEIDQRAAVKGSRDPLGRVPLWSRLGRRIVRNLTTVTTSVRGFTTLLLGHAVAERLAREHGRSPLASVLKVEQLVGHARWRARRDGAFRGIDRVRALAAEGPVVRLSDRPEDQILGNQKIYGLWGLYTVAARESGLLRTGDATLTEPARRFIEDLFERRCSRAGLTLDGFARRLAPERVRMDLGEESALIEALAELHSEQMLPGEAEIWLAHLVHSGVGDAAFAPQVLLAGLLDVVDPDAPLTLDAIARLAVEARRRGGEHELVADVLQQIHALERVIVPADRAFWSLLSRHGTTLRDAADALHASWRGPLGFIDAAAVADLERDLLPALPDPSQPDHWSRIAAALAAGEWERSLALLVEHSAAVMQARGGAPWVRVRDGVLDVRFRDEWATPGDREDVEGVFANNYFVGSLHAVRRQVASGVAE